MTDACMAIVETRSGRRFIGYTHHSQCKRRGVETAGHLRLCKSHAHLCRRGFIREDGQVAPKSVMDDYRKYPEKFPQPWFDWLPGANPKSA